MTPLQICLVQDTVCLRAFALAVFPSQDALSTNMLMVPFLLHCLFVPFSERASLTPYFLRNHHPLLSVLFYLSAEHLSDILYGHVCYVRIYISPRIYNIDLLSICPD